MDAVAAYLDARKRKKESEREQIRSEERSSFSSSAPEDPVSSYLQARKNRKAIQEKYFDGLDTSVIDRAKGLYAEDYASKYNILEADDKARKAKGLIPAAYDKKYDDTDIDRYLYSEGLPSYSDFSKYYDEAAKLLAEEKAEAEETPQTSGKPAIPSARQQAGGAAEKTEREELKARLKTILDGEDTSAMGPLVQSAQTAARHAAARSSYYQKLRDTYAQELTARQSEEARLKNADTDALTRKLEEKRAEADRLTRETDGYGYVPLRDRGADYAEKTARRDALEKEARELETEILAAQVSQTQAAADFEDMASKGVSSSVHNAARHAAINAGEREKAGPTARIAAFGGGAEEEDGNAATYRTMTETERKTYNALLQRYGERQASAYIDSIREQLHYRRGQEMAEDVERSPIKGIRKGALAFSSGIDQWGSNLAQSLTDKVQPTSARQFAAQTVREGIDSKVGRVAFDLAQTSGNMLPSVLLGAATGMPALGTASLVTSAAGGAYKQARSEGYDDEEARLYGYVVGGLEGAMSQALGGISALGGKLTGHIAQRAVQNIERSALKAVASLGIKSAGEFSEEYIQEIIDPVVRNLILGEDNEFKAVTPEALYAGLLGALSAGLMESAGVAGETAAYARQGRALADAKAVESLLSGAARMERGSRAQELAEKMQTGKLKITDTNVGELFFAAQAEGGDVFSIYPQEESQQPDIAVEEQAEGAQLPDMPAEVPAAAEPSAGMTLPAEAIHKTGQNTQLIRQNAQEAGQNIPAQQATPRLDRRMRDVQDKARALGIRVQFADLGHDREGRKIQGSYDNGTIYIDAEATDPMMTVFRHELTHHIEESGTYQQLSDYVFEIMGEQNINVDAAIRGEAARLGLSEEQAKRELVATFVQDKLFAGDKSTIDDLVRYHNNIAVRIYAWLRDMIGKLGKSSEAKQLRHLELLFSKSFHEAADAMERGEVFGKRPAAQPQNSIQQTAEGDRYVKVDTGQDIFDGKSSKEIAQIARSYIRNHFRNKYVGSGAARAHISAKSESEYVYPAARRGMSSDVREAKLRASTELPHLLSVSSFVEHKENEAGHYNPEAVNGWDYYETVFEVGGRYFRGKVNILRGDGYQRLYDITQIKEVTGSARGLSSLSSNAPSSGDNTSISAKEEKSNSSDKQKSIGTPWEEMIARYGSIPAGEKPVRDIRAPQRVDDNTRVRRFVRTVSESNAITDDMVEDIKAELLAGGMSYKPISDKETLFYAETMMSREKQAEAWRRWENVVDGTEQPTKQGIAIGEALLRTAAAHGDAAAVVKLTAELSALLTQAGQVVQSARLLKKAGPAGDVYYLKQVESKLNRELEKQFKKKSLQVELNEDLVVDLLNAEGDQARQEAVNALIRDLAQQMPATWTERWNAWRYLAMLGNPRTHVRNIVGNVIFMPAVKMKNMIGAGLEKAVVKQGGERSKALRVSREYRDYAKADYENVREELMGSGKMNPMDVVRDQKRIFNTGFLEWARKLNSAALEKEDAWFLHRHYADALGQYLQANRIDLQSLAEGSAQLMEARRYAMKEAQKATYRDANELSQWLSSLAKPGESTGSKIRAAAVEGILPFKQTPVNILRRGIEYSPITLLKQLTYGVKKLRAGDMSAVEFIDGIASGLTGTAIMALGWWLHSIGAVSGTLGENDKEKALETLKGEQDYALRLGDTSYTVDWAAPLSLPFFVGVEMAEAASADREDISFKDILSALSKITEPAFNLSMLQGVEGLLESISYAQNGKITSAIGEIASSYLSQAFPTLGGQIARTIDDTRRSSYYEDKNLDIPGGVQSFVRRAASKIPGLASQNEPYIDLWGEKEVTDGVLQRGFENFISPGYISRLETNEVEAEIESLYEQTGETGVIPSKASKNFTSGGEKVNLSASEYTEFSRVLGQTRFSLLEDMIALPSYEVLNEAEKIDAFSTAYRYSQAYAKKQLKGIPMDNWMEEAEGGDVAQVIIDRVNAATQQAVNQQNMSELKDTIHSGISEYSNDLLYTAQGYINELKANGKEDSDIRSLLTKEFKPVYIAYYNAGDEKNVIRVRNMLTYLEIGYDHDDFRNWEKAAKAK